MWPRNWIFFFDNWWVAPTLAGDFYLFFLRAFVEPLIADLKSSGMLLVSNEEETIALFDAWERAGVTRTIPPL
jgi:hypothetical protein